MQLLRRPFRTYYSELDRLVVSSDAVLFAGYGFGDRHLNLAFEGFRDSRRRPVAIIEYARDGAMTVGSAILDQPNRRVNTILRIFQTDFSSMSWLGYTIPNMVNDLKKAKEFEICNDPNTPLSAWYNGMLTASE